MGEAISGPTRAHRAEGSPDLSAEGEIAFAESGSSIVVIETYKYNGGGTWGDGGQ